MEAVTSTGNFRFHQLQPPITRCYCYIKLVTHFISLFPYFLLDVIVILN